jgi:hypothetical protein
MKTARNRIGEVMEGWRVVAQPRQHRGVLLCEIQHQCGFKRTVYPQDWRRGFVACPKCKYDAPWVAARTANEGQCTRITRMSTMMLAEIRRRFELLPEGFSD